MPSRLIEAAALSKRYRDFTAVNDISFHVELNECFGLLGPNGAGKSTVIKMVSGVAPPTGGTLTVAGLDVTRHSRSLRPKGSSTPVEYRCPSRDRPPHESRDGLIIGVGSVSRSPSAPGALELARVPRRAGERGKAVGYRPARPGRSRSTPRLTGR